MLYYRDIESYEGQSRCESSDRRSGSSAEGQLIVEWLRSAPRPLNGMPRGNEEGAPRFSGHPDDLIWFLEDVRDLCMQAGCYEDHEWARWCPAVCYSKRDLYDLVNKQKKVEIDSYQALLNYRLSFTDIAAQLRISSQLLWIEKDDLFLEGLLEEGYCFELREDSSKPLKVPGVGLRSQAVEVDGIEVAVAELSGPPLVEGRCETSFEHIEVTSYIAKESLTAELQGECLQGNIEEQSEGKVLGAKASVELKVTEAWGDSPVSQPEYFHSSPSPHTDIPPQNSSIKPQHAEDEPRANERPIEAVACVPDLPKPTLEPRGDLCEVLEHARSVEVEETESGVEAEGQSKVVARRKPPEVKVRRKTLKSVSRTIKEILPEFWRTHGSGRSSGWTILLIYWQQGWTRSLGVETCMTSPSTLSQPAKRSGTTALRVNNAHSLVPRTCSVTAVEIYAGLSQKSKNHLFKGYESLEGKVIWSATLSFQGHEAGDQAEAMPRPPLALGTRPEPLPLCFYVFLRFSEESNEHETPSRLVCRPHQQLTLDIEHRARRLKVTLEGVLGLPRRHSLERRADFETSPSI
ncbi:hypothetical protein EDD17DRAFT_1504855 [Pisolithus thermaeus]|nr:hypothetical protein EDD17DRAFT_1504855 [Pisolithus thermaeus]